MYHVLLEINDRRLTASHNSMRAGLLLRVVKSEYQDAVIRYADIKRGKHMLTGILVSVESETEMTKLTQLGRLYGQDPVWVFDYWPTAEELADIQSATPTDALLLRCKVLAVDYSAIILNFEAWSYATELNAYAFAPKGNYVFVEGWYYTFPDDLEEKASLFLGLDIAWSVTDGEEGDEYGDGA